MYGGGVEVPKAVKRQGARATQAWQWEQNLARLQHEWAEIQKLDRFIEQARAWGDKAGERVLWTRLHKAMDGYRRRGVDLGEDPEGYVPSEKRREAGRKGGAAGKGSHKVRRSRRERMGDA